MHAGWSNWTLEEVIKYTKVTLIWDTSCWIRARQVIMEFMDYICDNVQDTYTEPDIKPFEVNGKTSTDFSEFWNKVYSEPTTR